MRCFLLMIRTDRGSRRQFTEEFRIFIEARGLHDVLHLNALFQLLDKF